MTDSLTITDNRTGQSYTLPIEHNAVRSMDFKNIKLPEDQAAELFAGDQHENGLRLLDPGFQNTACMTSQVCFVDGNAGQISYRGIAVGDLYRSGRPFDHIAFLLIFGHLPSDEEAAAFKKSITNTPLPDQSVFDMIAALPLSERKTIESKSSHADLIRTNAHPATAIASAVAAYVACHSEKVPASQGTNLYKGNMVTVDDEIPHFLSTYSTIAAAVFCRLKGRKFQPPLPEFSYVENVLYMMGYVDPSTGQPDPRVVSVLNRHWILTADHELANSTAGFLHAASTLSDPYSCSAVSHLSGAGILHGGAMEVAHKQLATVGDVTKVPALIEQVKKGKFRLFGYGHRTYKVTDPRSYFIHELIAEASSFSKAFKDDKGLQVALEIDRIASQDEYFVSRNLCANVDLFLSHIYSAIGIPADFILPMSLLGRTPGMLAHWREACRDSKPRMWRPLQLYTGNVPSKESINGNGSVNGTHQR